MKSPQQVWALPFTHKPMLDFEANASNIEIVPVEAGAVPRIESLRAGAQVDVKQSGDTVTVRLAGFDSPWGGNPFERLENAHDEHRRQFGRPPAPRRGPIAEELIRGIAGAVFNGRFGGAFVLHVPANVKARIVCNMGEVELQRLNGCDLNLSMSAGSLNVDETRGRFKVRAEAGRILFRRVGGTLDINSGMGAAMLDIVALDEGEHRVTSTMGSVKVDLVPGLDVRIESRTVMGSTRTRYTSNDAAKAVLKLEAELGSVRVREGAAYDDPRRGDWADWRKLWKEDDAPPVADPPPSTPPDATELRKVLDLVQQKKVSPEEAERLISALHGN